MWMWWDHYIYCNFWAHAVVHRVHHTPTRRLESQSARFIWPGAIFLGVPSLWVASSRALESLYVDGIRTPDSTPLSRAHAGPCARGASAHRSQENEIERTGERSAEKSGKKTPPCSPRDRTRRAGAELMRRFGTIPCRLDSQLDQTLSSLLSQVHTGHRILLELRPVWRACHSPLPAKLMRVVFA